jgi:hypothetical protein
MQHFKDKNNKIWGFENDDTQGIIDKVALKNNVVLTSITQAQFKKLTAPTAEDIQAKDIQDAKAYLRKTDHKFLNNYVLKDGEDLAPIQKQREKLRTLIRKNNGKVV